MREKLAAFAVDDTSISLARSILVLQARYEVIAERVDKYIGEIFAKYEFYPADMWTDRVCEKGQKLSLDDLYLTDIDSEQYKQFWQECDAAHRSGPFAHIVEEQDAKHGRQTWCPKLCADSDLREAQFALRKHAGEMVDDSFGHCHLTEHIHSLNKLLLGLVLNGPRGGELSDSEQVLAYYAN